MERLPSPFDRLANCVWLPRILAKARQLAAGTLPKEYAARFGSISGVDGHFLAHFGLTREDIVSAAAQRDEDAATWFLGQAGCSAERIEAWNDIGQNLGRPGYPIEKRFPLVMATIYKEHVGKGFDNVFDVIVEDERAIP